MSRDESDPPSPEPTVAQVLVVDDERLVRQTLVHMLHLLGHEVVEAEDGAAAIRRCEERERAFDLILLDFSLPTLSPSEILGRVRELGHQTPVVLMSGFCAQDVDQNLGVEGIVEFVQKPFHLETLRRILAEVVG